MIDPVLTPGALLKSDTLSSPRRVGKWHYAGLFSLVLVLTFVRSYNAFRYPILHYEDGVIMFAHYINHPDPSGIFRFYGGYISLLPNLIGYLATRFSIGLSPYLMVFASLLITTFAHTVFALPHYRFAFANDWGRYVFCILLALLPLGNSAIHSSITYSQWHWLWLLLLLVLVPAPVSLVNKVGWIGFLGLVAWSHPLSILAIPLIGLSLLMRRNKIEIVSAIILFAVIIAYQLVGVQTQDKLQSLSFPSVNVTAKYILHRVVFESLFGNRLRLYLHEHQMDGVIIWTAWLVIGLLLSSLWLRRSRISAGNFVLLGAASLIIGGISLGSVVGRSMDGTTHLGGWEHRYFYLQQMAFILLLVFSLFQGYSVHNWEPYMRIVAIPLTVGLGIGLLWSNLANHVWFYTPPEQGKRVQAFVYEVEQRISSGNELIETQPLILDRGGGFWDIRIEGRGSER